MSLAIPESIDCCIVLAVKSCSARPAEGVFVKLISEYLERAQQFERLAEAESDPAPKQALRAQAQAYYDLAATRAKQMNVPMPSVVPRLDPNA